MKMIFAAAILVFQAGSVLAGSCRPIEDAELKEISTEQPAKTYCTYQQLADNDHEAAIASIKPFREAARQGRPTASFEKAVVEHMVSADECWEQAGKIKSALKNRSDSTADPQCEPQ
jgi:hypothetical protein